MQGIGFFYSKDKIHELIIFCRTETEYSFCTGSNDLELREAMLCELSEAACELPDGGGLPQIAESGVNRS